MTSRGADLFDPRAQPFEDRVSVNREAKRAIARHVVKLIGKANTLLLDSSTTVYQLSDLMGHGHGQGDEPRDLYVVTGGLPLFTELLRKAEGVRVALHGGEPQVRTGSLVGPLAVRSLVDSRFDFVVMSCMGVVDDEGDVFVSNSEEVAVKQAYLRHARKKILACDQSKFGQSGSHRLGPLSDFDYIVTEKAVMTVSELAGSQRKPAPVKSRPRAAR